MYAREGARPIRGDYTPRDFLPARAGAAACKRLSRVTLNIYDLLKETINYLDNSALHV